MRNRLLSIYINSYSLLDSKNSQNYIYRLFLLKKNISMEIIWWFKKFLKRKKGREIELFYSLRMSRGVEYSRVKESAKKRWKMKEVCHLLVDGLKNLNDDKKSLFHFSLLHSFFHEWMSSCVLMEASFPYAANAARKKSFNFHHFEIEERKEIKWLQKCENEGKIMSKKFGLLKWFLFLFFETFSV